MGWGGGGGEEMMQKYGAAAGRSRTITITSPRMVEGGNQLHKRCRGFRDDAPNTSEKYRYEMLNLE